MAVTSENLPGRVFRVGTVAPVLLEGRAASVASELDCGRRAGLGVRTAAAVQSSSLTPGCFPEESKNTHLKRYVHPYVHSSIIHNS